MSTFFASTLVAVAAAVLGAIVSSYIAQRKPNSTKRRNIITKSTSGKIEVITVPANTSDQAVEDYVISSARLERDIAQQVKKLQQTIRNLQVHHGNVVDIVAALEGARVAIEVKSNLESVDLRSIRRYMSEGGGIDKLLIVSSQPPPNRLLEATRDLVESGRVSILKIDPASPADGKTLRTAVTDALQVTQA